jgi:asparagine synthase (glutamine-hydrolysing)
MCGILGWVGAARAIEALPLLMLRHRGPDDQGQETYRSQSQRVSAVLGSTRLAIIDLSPAGHMPMEYPGEPLAIVFNGEIYNFQELRAELESQGERFFSRTDTEVILRGYRVWGDGVVERLQGMFAFALWDGRGEGRLLLARDRFGKKPLYYREDAGKGIWFASESKALLVDGGPREIDPGSLEYYLDRGYPPSDRGMLLGYRKVLPGHLLVWERGELRDRPYWDLPDANPSLRAISNEEAKWEMQARLTEAVSKRLVADVPIGLLLSGGVDSSSLLTLMAKFFPNPVATYTACFGPVNLDESEKARQTALLMGCRHHAIMISPRSGRLLPFIASQMDEPVADPSAIATYLICRRARKEVTVLLTGDGADELLLGYPRYRLHAASQIISRLPLALRIALSAVLTPGSLFERAFSAPADPLRRDRYWLDHGLRRTGAFTGAPPGLSSEEAVRRVLQDDIKTWLVEDILMKVDKMSMAASVEIRVPFLDQRLAEWVLGLPVAARMSWVRGKKVLYDAMRDLVPPHISWLKKQPFHLPINDWLRSEWRPLAQDVLLDRTTRQRGWMDDREVARLLEEHLSGKAQHGRRLYQLLILELWARALLDKGEAEPLSANLEDCARDVDPERPLRRISVIAPAGIGDTMRLTPVLNQLGNTDPNVSVTLYLDRGRGSDEAMAGLSPVDRQVPLDFRGKLIGRIIPLLRDIRRNTPDFLVSTWFSQLAGLVGLLSGVSNRVGYVPRWSAGWRIQRLLWRDYVDYNPSGKDVAVFDTQVFSRAMGLAAGLAPIFAEPIWVERALSLAQGQLAALERPILAVNAVAQSSIKQREYPLDLMAAVLEGLLQKRVVNGVLLLGDAYSRSRHGPLRNILGSRGLDLSGELSLTASAALIRECDAMLTVDGGLFHVALASRLPIVAIFGPTDVYSQDPREIPGRYLPISAHDRCQCLYRSHRGIRVQAQCREAASCLATISPSRITAAMAALMGPAAAGQGAAPGLTAVIAEQGPL